ncbi:carbon storage regulator [Escherichia coli]|nr:carbon storage regulator [Escherichia coli]EFI8595785.1 carbon storage regulator [Escherichia coli]
MLVLSRRIGEALLIGSDLTIEVLRTDQNQGEAIFKITAPEHVSVRPAEVRKQGVVITHKRRSRLPVQG